MLETPLHPKLVHFAIAFILGALVLDVLGLLLKKQSLTKAAVIILVMAALSSVLALASGLLEEQRLHLQHPLLEQHERMAFITTGLVWLATVLQWLLKDYPQWRQVITTFLLAGISLTVLITAHLGGTMVYQYGVGVTP